MLSPLRGPLGRISHEILTQQRTEVLELEEPFFKGEVGNSTMPYKHNRAVLEHDPALCRNVISCMLFKKIAGQTATIGAGLPAARLSERAAIPNIGIPCAPC